MAVCSMAGDVLAGLKHLHRHIRAQIINAGITDPDICGVVVNAVRRNAQHKIPPFFMIDVLAMRRADYVWVQFMSTKQYWYRPHQPRLIALGIYRIN